MVSLPRVVTVDPSGTLARIVRAAAELSDRSVIQIDVPSSAEALDEINRAGCQLLVAALRSRDEAHGADLGLRVKQAHPEAAVVILADEDVSSEFDQAARGAPFLYLRRPVDPAQFLRVLVAGIEGSDIFSAGAPPIHHIESSDDLGPIPQLDLKAAQRVVDSLLTDVGAMAIVLASRGGKILLERGAVGYLDREQLIGALLPMVRATIDMGQLVGGQPASLQFYDGDRYDVFVLSAGLHHFMCLVYDGQIGSRQFGAVNRFGRRAAEDLITILGKGAFTLASTPAQQRRPKPREAPAADAPPEPLIARSEDWTTATPLPLPEPEPIQLEPIADLDFSIFDKSALAALDLSAADDLFDPDKLAEIANETRRDRGPLSYDEARELGIIP